MVLVFLESWSSVYMKSYGSAKDSTPYFDTLRKRSLTTNETLAGGHRTTEGLFATLCSWQNPLGETIAQSQLQNYDYNCLPELLRNRGYATAFFQGTLENTSGTGAFAQALGFEQSYGKRDIKTRQYEENSWGVQDPDLYHFVLGSLDKMPQPFFIGINTATTHDSQVPESFLQQMGQPDENGLPMPCALPTTHWSSSSQAISSRALQRHYLRAGGRPHRCGQFIDFRSLPHPLPDLCPVYRCAEACCANFQPARYCTHRTGYPQPAATWLVCRQLIAGVRTASVHSRLLP